MHKLLQRQLRQAQQASADGSLDLDALLTLVGAAYDEIDRERRFTARAHQVLRDEYAALTARQVQIHTAMARVEAEKADAERARAAAEAELLKQERMSLLGRLTASVAHELRNPLSTIRNTVHAIGEAAVASQLDVGRQMARVYRTIDRCDGIIGDLLDYAASRDMVPSPIRLDTWLNEVLNDQKVPASVTVERRLAAPGAVVAIDPDRLRCAFLKVFENALEALVETPDLTERRITVATVRAEQLEIAVSDTGPGIPPEILPRVFEPLFSTRSFGTGLGLATAKQIVEQHGGDIAVGRDTEGGARIVIRLPLVASKSAAA
jgi:signal transduction histidine kinase